MRRQSSAASWQTVLLGAARLGQGSLMNRVLLSADGGFSSWPLGEMGLRRGSPLKPVAGRSTAPLQRSNLLQICNELCSPGKTAAWLRTASPPSLVVYVIVVL